MDDTLELESIEGSESVPAVTVAGGLPRLPSSGEYKVYSSRWYIIIFFSLAAALQNTLWLTYNTIGDVTMSFFQVSEDMVNLISTMPVIVFIISVLPISLLANNYGLRKSMIASSLMLLACGVGRLAFQQRTMFPVIFALQAINALAAPVLNSTPSMLAGIWFPPQERSLATAAAFLSQFLGTAAAFLLGFLVKTSDDISKRLWIEAAITAAICVPILVYFPDGPPTPPSASSSKRSEDAQSSVGRHFVKELNKSQRIVDIRAGLPRKEPLVFQVKTYLADMRTVGRSRPFLLSTLSGALAAGLYDGWSGVVTDILLPLGYDADDVAWVGFSTSMAAIIGGIIVGRIAGNYPLKLKEIIVGLLATSSLASIWFVASLLKIFPANLASFVISASVASLAMNATTPLFFQLAIELTYPSPEAATGGVLTLVLNVIAAIYMLAVDILSSTAINVLFVLLIVLALVLMIFTPVEYKRAEVDMKSKEDATNLRSKQLSTSTDSTDSNNQNQPAVKLLIPRDHRHLAVTL